MGTAIHATAASFGEAVSDVSMIVTAFGGALERVIDTCEPLAMLAAKR